MKQPEHISSHLSSIGNRLQVIGNRENKDIKPITYKRRVVLALEETEDLIDDPRYKPWFVRKIRELGPDRYLGVARQLREDIKLNPQSVRQPGRLFVDRLMTA